MADRRRHLRRRDVVQASSPSSATADAAAKPKAQVAKLPTTSWLVPLKRTEWVALVVLELGVLLVYASTLYPSVAGGDSGELVAESCHLGVSHPPGYPLFNMLVHGWMRVLASLNQAANPAWSANLFSAVCDAVATGLIFLTIAGASEMSVPLESDTRWAAAASAAALFAFSPLIWTYAVSAEVFALNNLFAALLIYLLLMYERRQRDFRSAVVGAFVCGLAMCNQHTSILFELPIIAWVLYTRRRTISKAPELETLSAAFFVGLLPYAYMPITSTWNPQPGSWGDVTSVLGFVHHIRRADYGTFRLFSTSDETEGLWTRLYLYAIDLSTREIPLHLALPIVLLGIWSSLRLKVCSQRQTPGVSAFGVMLVALYAFYMLVFHSLSNLPLNERLLYGVHMRFWQQPNVIVFIWVGLGFQYLQKLVAQTRSSTLVTAVQATCLALVAVQVGTWYELMDQSQAYFIRDYARALLDPLPSNSVMFVSFDLHWTAIRYLQRCEHFRPDITVLQLSMMTYAWFSTKHATYPELSFPGSRLVAFGSQKDGFTMAGLLDVNMDTRVSARKRRRFFLGGHLNYNDQDFNAKYSLVPFGLVDEFTLLSQKQLPISDWYEGQQSVMNAVRGALPTLPPPEKYDDETWEWTIARNHGMKRLSWSTYLLQRAIEEDPHNISLFAEATHAMEHSYQFEPQQFWTRASNLKNLGLAYAQIVKSPLEFNERDGDPFLNDNVGKSVGDWKRFKDRASARMLELWFEWLQVPEARADPGYSAIESVVRKFVPDAAKISEQKASATTKKKKSKKKRRKD